MSANDVLDVLNVQRDDIIQPAKKKARSDAPPIPKSGISRELYNLIGANTPPILVNMGNNRMKDRKLRVSPWTRMPFVPNQRGAKSPTLYHWEKGAKELLAEKSKDKPYYFDKFVVSVDIPEMVDEELFEKFMAEIREQHRLRTPKTGAAEASVQQGVAVRLVSRQEAADESNAATEPGLQLDSAEPEASEEPKKAAPNSQEDASSQDTSVKEEAPSTGASVSQEAAEAMEVDSAAASEEEELLPWTYEETKLLFQYCKDFELKWFVINDCFPLKYGRSLEDLKEQFYAMCYKIMTHKAIGNPLLLDSLKVFSKSAEIERKHYLHNLLKRTPTEIAEESLLVIEARRFEIAAKKMLQERANLLALLDLPQVALSVQQYMNSQGLSSLYNLLMILVKNRKKNPQKVSPSAQDPVPPPIPMAASSSHKRDFQTHLQQHLSGFVKLQPYGSDGTPIQQLLAKKLTVKEEEAYGLFYHANERLTPGMILRSTQRLSGLQQRQSVFKAVINMLSELDIPTASGTTWKPNMPTRKTMAKYDELTKAVVALLEVKKGKDKLEAEIELVKSQRGLQ
ncbi:hypothetical protein METBISCDRAFT_15472 [Metschnikowia bicuspidata]|uniref:SWR1-complex protein 4 n=1 Tax=Metschnikowia bicuspidata TaxID=27322 RepID=A0A4P9ZDC2_9ASCO|nr:hypothetical protein METBISCDRAFT_15472 [Metschnikowia bicuspidata]